MKNIWIILILLTLLSASCTTVPKITKAESEAEKIYRIGVFYLEEDEYENAEKQFMKVITEFSFSKYEPMATIKLADTYFEKEEFASALEVFKRFLTMRPNNELADYAFYKLGVCYFEQRPSDFILLPPPEEKDIAVIESAAASFRSYLKKYPEGNYVKEAKDYLLKAETILISRELSVAEFYLNKEKCPAVKMRLSYIKKHFTVESQKLKERLATLEQSCAKQQ